ncbi:hypothetical protein BGZ49_002511, partial [Haplosporangium sp. Z 27]
SSSKESDEPLVAVETLPRELSDQSQSTVITNKIEETIIEQEEPIIAISNSIYIVNPEHLSTSSDLTSSYAIVENGVEIDQTQDDLVRENNDNEQTNLIDTITDIAAASTITTTTTTTTIESTVVTASSESAAVETDDNSVATVDTVDDTFAEDDIVEKVDDYKDQVEDQDQVEEFETVYEYIEPKEEHEVKAEEVQEIQEEEVQEEEEEEILEREMVVTVLQTETTQTSKTEEELSMASTEETDQADTPTTLVGDEMELTKDTLQTLQEVSRVAKHSELNAKATEFKPSWLFSPQQPAPVSRPEAPQVESPTVKQVIKLKSRCHYWPNCTNKACKYTHPSQPCRDGDNCQFGERCIFIHPKDETTPRPKKGPKPSSQRKRPLSSATMTSVSPVEPWGRV